jgi:hypothetical protein
MLITSNTRDSFIEFLLYISKISEIFLEIKT